MNLVLSEDVVGRRWRLVKQRRELRNVSKNCLLYGVPLGGLVPLVQWIVAPGLAELNFDFMLAPVFLALVLMVVPALGGLLSNRWTLTPAKILLRGVAIGSVRWNTILEWSINSLSDLPGYYCVRLKLKHGPPFEIALPEATTDREVLCEKLAGYIGEEKNKRIQV